MSVKDISIHAALMHANSSSIVAMGVLWQGCRLLTIDHTFLMRDIWLMCQPRKQCDMVVIHKLSDMFHMRSWIVMLIDCLKMALKI